MKNKINNTIYLKDDRYACRSLASAVVLQAIRDYKTLQSDNSYSADKLKKERDFKRFFDNIGKPAWYQHLKKRYKCPKCSMFDRVDGVCNRSLYVDGDCD